MKNYDIFVGEIKNINLHIKNLKRADLHNMKYFDLNLFQQMPLFKQKKFISIVRSGLENPASSLGCYAMETTDYDEYQPFFDQVIRDYHKAAPNAVHVTDWDASNVGENGVLDVTKLGLPELSMRVRVGRNLAAFNLPGSMDQAERIEFEKTKAEEELKLRLEQEEEAKKKEIQQTLKKKGGGFKWLE